MTDYALTLALRQHIFTVLVDGDRESWVIVEVAQDGRVLAYRMRDEPYYDQPGVAYHRWFDGSVLADEIAKNWDRDWGLR